MLRGNTDIEEILETIKSFEEANKESRNYLMAHTSHFIRYVGSRSGSSDAGDDNDLVLEAIGTNTDLLASLNDSMTSVEFRKFSVEIEEEINSKAAEEKEAMGRSPYNSMDEGSRENSPEPHDDMDLEDNPDLQVSESTDRSLTPGIIPKVVFATSATKKAKKKKKTPAKDPAADEVITKEYEEDSYGALIPDEPKALYWMVTWLPLVPIRFSEMHSPHLSRQP